MLRPQQGGVIALGILPDGTKEIRDIWIEQSDGAKFWMRIMNALKNRSVANLLITVIDGLKGFLDAVNAVSGEGCSNLHWHLIRTA